MSRFPARLPVCPPASALQKRSHTRFDQTSVVQMWRRRRKWQCHKNAKNLVLVTNWKHPEKIEGLSKVDLHVRFCSAFIPCVFPFFSLPPPLKIRYVMTLRLDTLNDYWKWYKNRISKCNVLMTLKERLGYNAIKNFYFVIYNILFLL